MQQTILLDDLRAGDCLPVETGYSTILPDFDFETYSEAGMLWDAQEQAWVPLPGMSNNNKGLPHVGARNYVEHPTFEILSLSYDLKDGKGKRWWRPDPYIKYQRYPTYQQRPDLHPAELIEHIRSNKLIEAWNVFFEWTVWNYHGVVFLGWPPLEIENCRDAMVKSRVAAYPGKLKEASKVLKLVEAKDEDGTRLINKLTKPKTPTKKNPELRWTPFTAADDFKKFYEYNIRDIRAEAEASSKLPDLNPREFRNWQADFRINMRGMHIDTAAVEDCVSIIEQCERKYNGEISYLTNNAVTSYTQVADILAWMRGRGVYLEALNEDTLEAALARTDYPRDVLRVLRLRQMLSFSSVRKYYSLRAQTNLDSRLRDQYVFYGAHTGLWNGQNVQPANLYKGIFSKPHEVEQALAIIRTRNLEALEKAYPDHDALEVIASCLRSMVTATPGGKLISADFTAIQAVATSCMSNEQWRIDVFRTHGKIYEAMASRLTGNSLEYYLAYKKEYGKHHEDRQLGKLAVLSADFGAWIHGWKRFGAEKYGDDDFIKQLILKTRDAIPNVVLMWGGQTIDKFKRTERQHLFGLEGAAISAILTPGVCYSSRPGSRLGVLYEVYEDILFCKPPSGGFIRYHAPRLQPSTRDYASPWEYEMSYEGWNSNQQKGRPGWLRMSLYGGVCMQNVISHMCRELQADTLTALEDAGFPVVMHTHDENVTDVTPAHTVERYMEIVNGAFPWWAYCEDGTPWPIKIPTAWEAYRYGKWED